jgi:hypothetical protein
VKILEVEPILRARPGRRGHGHRPVSFVAADRTSIPLTLSSATAHG